MKPIQQTIFLFLVFLTLGTSVQAQGWNQNRKSIYSLGMGATQVIFLPYQYYPISHRSSQGLTLNISGEYKVHKIIGVGWQTGLNLFVYGRYYNNKDKTYYNSTSVGIPIGLKMNIHILEATTAPIKDKLDIYAGFGVGGGPAFHNDGVNQEVIPFMYAGPQIGVRYWIDKIAIFGEIGWGASIFNLGITF